MTRKSERPLSIVIAIIYYIITTMYNTPTAAQYLSACIIINLTGIIAIKCQWG